MDNEGIIKGTDLPDIKVDLNNIKFAFQPIFSAISGEIFGYEALMRPDGCTPMELIKSYEKVNMLSKIEEVTLYYGTKAFKEAKLDGFLFLNSFPGTCMSIEVAMATAEMGGPEMADRFYIEVLEYTKYNAFAWELKKRAMFITDATPRIVIDDYGTGENIDKKCIDIYKPDIVKVDRKYVSHIESNKEHQEIVDTMIRILHGRGIKVLAEGIETEEEYNYFKNTDIDFLQGFYLGRPKIYE
ncbi:MAG: EAL domain-containing protein [Pseudobutyrivibrio sp.]|nr:EAL domain-containing protein [Pseudobutyrivibrio sp.]